MTTAEVPHHTTDNPHAVFRYTAPPARGVSRLYWIVGLALLVGAVAAVLLTR